MDARVGRGNMVYILGSRSWLVRESRIHRMLSFQPPTDSCLHHTSPGSDPMLISSEAKSAGMTLRMATCQLKLKSVT